MRLKATPIFEASLRTRISISINFTVAGTIEWIHCNRFNVSGNDRFVRSANWQLFDTFMLCLSKPLVPWPLARRQYLYASWSWQHISPQIDKHKPHKHLMKPAQVSQSATCSIANFYRKVTSNRSRGSKKYYQPQKKIGLKKKDQKELYKWICVVNYKPWGLLINITNSSKVSKTNLK